MKNNHCEKLGCFLAAKFDRRLTFNSHSSELCKKPSKKIHAVERVKRYINISKKVLLRTFL